MYVLPLESVYGVFGGAGQRLVPVGVVGVVEEGTTGAVVVSGGTGVVGPTDDGPPGDGPPDDGPTDDGPPGDGPTDNGPTDDGPTDDSPTGVDSTGVDSTGVVGTPGVVDVIGVVGPTKVVGSTGPVAGLVPVLVSTTPELSESVVVIAVVKVFGIVDWTGAVVIPVVVSTTVEPSEFVVVIWETKVEGSLDEANEYKVASRGAPQHSAMLPLHDVQVCSSDEAIRLVLEPQLHVSPRSYQYRLCE